LEVSLYKRRRGPDLTDTADILTIVVGVAVVAVVLGLLIRFQRGLLGIVLGSLAAILAVYWILEVRKTLKKEPGIKPTETKEWTPDIIEDENEILVVGKVPGPEERIRVSLFENLLEVKAGINFRELIRLPTKAVSFNTAYNNGVLEVRLRK